ncbi:MAG: hypothetical protein HYY44_05235 [Deltaproteobacteria bacterium]|nr:hypothetical protein [Deltaproteobacteria bacterium]
MSLPQVRSAVDRIIFNARNNPLTEEQVRPLLDRTDPPLHSGFMRNTLHTLIARHFYSGSIGDFLDRSEYQEVLRLFHLVELGAIDADQQARARLKAFKDRLPDSRGDHMAVWGALVPAFSAVTTLMAGGVLAVSRNVRHKMFLRMEPAKKHWPSVVVLIIKAPAKARLRRTVMYVEGGTAAGNAADGALSTAC